MGKHGPKPAALAPDMAAFRGMYLDAFKLAVTMDTAQSQALIKEGRFGCWKGRQHSTLDNPLTYEDREHAWVRWKNTENEKHKVRMDFLGAHTPRDTREMLVRFLAVAMTEESHDADKRFVAKAHHLAGEILSHPWKELHLPDYAFPRGYFHLQCAAVGYGGAKGQFGKFVDAVARLGVEENRNGLGSSFQNARDCYRPIWEKLTSKVMEERFARADAAQSQPT